MIATQNLTKEFAARVLFEDVTLQLNPGSRYGLVGANGSGKSTFMKVLSGDEPASAGNVVIAKRARVGVLRQDRFLDDGELILDLAMKGDALVWNALAQQKALEDGKLTLEPARMAELQDVIAANDGYTLEARSSRVLEGLGIPVPAHRQPLGTLSGGFKLRVLLAQVLVGGMDVLLLDEPTNHLDILTIRWLERFLSSYEGCAVIISHDQRFLNNVTTHILDVDYQTITQYTGNYVAFEKQKALIREQKEASIERAQEEIARKKAFVDRFGAKATKASQAQSRLKQIEKIEVEELVASSRRAPFLKFEAVRPSGREVLELNHVSKAYGDKKVLANVSMTVRRGERVALIGANGLGKSTLLRIAVERLNADTGEVKWGHETHVGYFPQDHREVLDQPKQTPFEMLYELCPLESISFVRGQLGRVLFSGSDVEKRIDLLSGGEAARLIFARLAIQKPNVLVMDEPTNHLDMETIQALIDALKAYPGTILFVSHDRYFVSELATHIVEITPTGLKDFPGTYNEYLERCGDDHLDAEAVALKARRAKQEAQAAKVSGNTDAAGNTLSWEEQKKRRARQNQLPKLRDKALAGIEAAEARKKEISEIYCAPGFFERHTFDDIAKFEAEQKALEKKLETLMAEWEQIETELAAVGEGEGGIV
ncbi:MAG: ABC-F family ATP-binding cassette domain-containing protein [Deltaproteobacteria bacterium]|nr:ABC-F family ATP-binding cassette domain-containing protein [Deltaproteobacteria bacterium]